MYKVGHEDENLMAAVKPVIFPPLLRINQTLLAFWMSQTNVNMSVHISMYQLCPHAVYDITKLYGQL